MNIVYSADGRCISNSHNLRGILEHARKQCGVRAINVYKLNDEAERRPGAWLCIVYQTGAVGQTFFASASHAVEWAEQQSKLSPRRSFWGGCKVLVYDVQSGTFDYSAACCSPAIPAHKLKANDAQS